jgi:hypothetical protein
MRRALVFRTDIWTNLRFTSVARRRLGLRRCGRQRLLRDLRRWAAHHPGLFWLAREDQPSHKNGSGRRPPPAFFGLAWCLDRDLNRRRLLGGTRPGRLTWSRTSPHSLPADDRSWGRSGLNRLPDSPSARSCASAAVAHSGSTGMKLRVSTVSPSDERGSVRCSYMKPSFAGERETP